MTQKKVIQCSDDEEDSVVVVLPSSHDDSDDGWEQSRDPNTISNAEKERNIKRAQQERNSSKIAKRPRVDDDNDNDDDIVYSKSKDIEAFRKIDYSSKNSAALDSSLLEDTPEFKGKAKNTDVDREEVLRKERELRLKNRAADLIDPIVAKNKVMKKVVDMIDLAGSDEEEEAGDTSDDDDDDDDDDEDDNDDQGVDGWQDDKSRSDVQDKAISVLRYCEEIGKTLRLNLSNWGDQGSDDVSASKTSTSKSNNFCTGLMTISNKGKKNEKNEKGEKGDGNGRMEVLGDDYFKNICPGLVLKAYQLVGVNWLKLLHENSINGVLADDMGLGKTVQTIAFLGWLKSTQSSSEKSLAHLIVVPASTLANWENELKRFCPSLAVVTYHGSQNERAELRHDLRSDMRAGRVDVVLSTFTIFERESSKDDRSFMYKQQFEYMIVDEAHCLKVSTSSRFMNLNAIKSGHRLLLSGTPVQNDLSELLSLMSFTMPKLFRNINIEEVLEGFGWDKKSGVPSSSSSAVSINQLRGMLAPFVLRRIKSDVLDQLPDKESFLEKVQMTSFQSNVYDNILYGHAK